MAYDTFCNEENVEERKLILLSIQNTRAMHSEEFAKLMKPLYLGGCDELLRVMVKECIQGLHIQFKDTYTVKNTSSDDAVQAELFPEQAEPTTGTEQSKPQLHLKL